MHPKKYLERAILKHSFEEQAREPGTVSGSESVQLAQSPWGFPLGEGRPVALSRGRSTHKLWDVETGAVIHTHEESLPICASAFGRDSSHELFAYTWTSPEAETRWSTCFKETARMISANRGGTPTKSSYANVRSYPVSGQIVASDPNRELLTLEHDEIKGYLPAATTTFTARDAYYGPKVSDLTIATAITATLAVEDEESWLESIVAPGRRLKGIYNLFTTPVTALCLSSDGSLALSNGNGDTFGMWNVWTGARLREFKGHQDRVTCLCLSIDASFALSGSEDRTLKLWKPISAECVRTFVGHESTITAVCLSMDTTKILSASGDGVIKLWDRATGECLLTIQAHTQNISGLHLSVDGKFAVSGSWDKAVKLWNLSDGSCMTTLEHSDWVTSVDMTPDGKYLVSSGYDATKVWELIWTVEPRAAAAWDEGARPYLEILLNANAAWDGKLGTDFDMTPEEIEQALQRHGPTWVAWHTPSKNLWHLGWDIEETLGHAGYGWLTRVDRETRKIMKEWERANRS